MNIIVNQNHISAAQQIKIDAWTADLTLWHDEVLRPERKKRLKFYDKHQLQGPWNDLTGTEQAEFTTWRTAMLNMTVTYLSYTASVIWPADCSFFEVYPG